jgi:hypothetical protein
MAEMQDDVEVGEIEAVEQQDSQAVAAVQKPAEVDDEIPEEFRGMSVKDLANIAKHARREMGRQANELGEVRKLADELIKSQLQPKQEPEKPKEVDFFENPQEAIRQAVETNPRVVAAEQFAIQAQREQAKQKLAQMHPDFGQVVRNSEFADWVKSSRVRTKLFQEAEAYDLDAADELLSTFKALKAVKQQAVAPVISDAEKTARSQAMQAAAVDTSGSGETSRKVYRRADLIRLKMRDPAKYEDMADEILAAYREGRVK